MLPEGIRYTKQLSYGLGAVERFWITPRTLGATDWRSAKKWEAEQVKEDAAQRLMHEASDDSRKYLALTNDQRRQLHAVEELARWKNVQFHPDGDVSITNDLHVSHAELLGMSVPRLISHLEDTGMTNAEARAVAARIRENDPDTIDRALMQMNPKLAFSKPREEIHLDDASREAFFERRGLFAQRWRDLMGGVAKKFGWDGDPDPAAVRKRIAELDPEEHKQEVRRLNHIAELLEAMRDQENKAYVPFMRFGDYYFSVIPKLDTKSIGGFPRSVAFHMIDSEPPFARALKETVGKGTARPEGAVPKAAQDYLAKLEQDYPPDRFKIRHGYLRTHPEMLRELDIPAVEKLLTALNQSENSEAFAAMVQELENTLYEELKSGFKKRAANQPGYSPDFTRATGSYLHWTSNHVADLLHGEEARRATEAYIAGHPDKGVRRYWQRYDAYQDSPAEKIRALQRVGFYYELAGNLSSSMAIGLHGPMVANFTLGIGLGATKSGVSEAAKHLYPALTQVSRAIARSSNTDMGLWIDLDKIPGITPDEFGALARAEQIGLFHSQATEDLRGLSVQGGEWLGENRQAWNTALRIGASNIAVMDRMNRIATFLAGYRMARKPGVMDGWAGAWKDNQLWQQMANRRGYTAENMARFLTDESAFVWGKRNRAEMARGWGSVFFAFKGFEMGWMGALWRNLYRMPQGRLAGLMMLAGVAALAGVGGLPFAQNIEGAADAGWNIFERLLGIAKLSDPNIEAKLQRFISDIGFGARGAEAILKGPLNAIGIDLSGRLGFGNIIGRMQDSPLALMGTVPGILWNAVSGAYNRASRGQPLGAVETALPAVVRNPFEGAVVYPHEGVRTQYQNKREPAVVPPEKLTLFDEIVRGIGLQPTDVSRAYDSRAFYNEVAAEERAYAQQHPSRPTIPKTPEQRVPRRARGIRSPYPQP